MLDEEQDRRGEQVEVERAADQLRLATTGKNFRTTAADLAAEHGVTVGAEVLEDWVAEEKKVVSEYLGQVLRPNPAVLGPLRRLAERYEFAAVSSSALTRLDECFRATGLDGMIPPGLIFIPFAYAEAAANVLTNPQLDPFGKIPEFKYCAVAVVKGGTPAAAIGYSREQETELA